MSGNNEIVNILFDHGALTNPVRAHLSPSRCTTRVSQKVHDNAMAALYVAAHRGDVDLARLLLDRGANVNHSVDGVTALYGAAQVRHRWPMCAPCEISRRWGIMI